MAATEKRIISKLTMEEILHCPRCSEVMIHDRTGFWRCPACGGEWWDDESKLALIKERQSAVAAEEDLKAQLRWSLSKQCDDVMPLVPVVDPRARGSRNSGRRRKKPQRKGPMTERWRLS